MDQTPLRVLMVVQRLLPEVAGAELQALGLAAALEELGVNVAVVATRYAPGIGAEDVVRGRPIRRVRVIRGCLLKPTQAAAMALFVARRARTFDLVHAHCLSPASLGAALAGRLRRVPVLVKPSLAGREGELRRVLRSPAGTGLVRVLRRVNAFATLDSAIADELTAAGIPGDRIAPVDNGVDLRTFRPARPGEREATRARLGLPRGPIVLFAGQLVERKAIRETLEAWRQLRPTLDDPLLLVAGDGPEREIVRQAAAEAGSRVRYFGFVDDVSDLMRASDAFVLPSRNESFGNAVLEAMASGLPVVVGRTGIAARLDIDAGAGRTLEKPEPSRIRRALDDVLAAARRGPELGAHARSLAERFAYPAVARRYLEIYQGLLDRARAS